MGVFSIKGMGLADLQPVFRGYRYNWQSSKLQMGRWFQIYGVISLTYSRYDSDHTYIYDLPNGAKNGRVCFYSDILSRNQCKEDYPFQPKVRCPDPVLFFWDVQCWSKGG